MSGIHLAGHRPDDRGPLPLASPATRIAEAAGIEATRVIEHL